MRDEGGRPPVRQPRDLSRVRDVGAVVLEAGEASALLLVTADQLADLARLRFAPTAVDELGTLVRAAGPGYGWLLAELQPTLDQAAEISGQWSMVSGQLSDDGADAAAAAKLVTLLHAITPGQRAAIITLAPTDGDNDGLTDTQEGWWCTDPNNANSDGPGFNDGWAAIEGDIGHQVDHHFHGKFPLVFGVIAAFAHRRRFFHS